MELRAADWEHAGEGARNVVLRYTGPQPALVGTVLRLPKPGLAETPETAEHASLERELWHHLPGFAAAGTAAERNFAFVQYELLPRLGLSAAHAGRLVAVPAAFTHSLWDHATLRHRAPSSAGSVLSVELKPKCGFLPAAATVGAGPKLATSRFSLHQRLKLAEGRIAQASSYCPLDLFSGEPGRMHSALRALLVSPQNNIAIRVDGQLVFGGAGCFSSGPQGGDSDMLAAALERIMPPSVRREAHLAILVRVIVEALRAHGVLARLLAVQQLDAHDVEGAIQAYCALLRLPAEEGCLAASCSLQSARERIRVLPRPEALSVLRDFLVAQSAKDAAIMLALQLLPAGVCHDAPAAADEVVVVDAESSLTFRVQAAFVDLELKRAASLPKYLKRDRAVVDAWLAAESKAEERGREEA